MKIALVALTAALLAGCASAPQWAHPALKGATNSGDMARLSSADCRSYATGRTQAPTYVQGVPTPNPSSYTTTGTVTTYGNYAHINAVTRPSGGFASGYAAGQNAGANMANALLAAAAQREVEDLAAACMRSLGWVDVGTEDGRKRMAEAE